MIFWSITEDILIKVAIAILCPLLISQGVFHLKMLCRHFLRARGTCKGCAFSWYQRRSGDVNFFTFRLNFLFIKYLFPWKLAFNGKIHMYT